MAVYKELRANDQIRERAYLVWANRSRTETGRKPEFLEMPDLKNFKAVPLISLGKNVSPIDGQPAVRILSPRRFQLEIGSRDVGQFDLPVYKDALSTTEQVLATPLAMTLDATVIGGAIFIWSIAAGGGQFWACLLNGH